MREHLARTFMGVLSLTVNHGFSVIINASMGALKAQSRVILSSYKVLFKTHARVSTSFESGATG